MSPLKSLTESELFNEEQKETQSETIFGTYPQVMFAFCSECDLMDKYEIGKTSLQPRAGKET